MNESATGFAPWWSGWSSGYPIYLTIAYTVIQPACVLLGLVGNFWILCVLLCRWREVRMSLSIKLYYGAIAVGDLLTCIRHLLWNVLCVSLALYSSDHVYFCFDVLSDFSCVILNIFAFNSEVLANYSLVGLSIERFIAVCLPLHAHALLSPKWTLFILSLLIVPFCVYFTILIPFAAQIFPTVRVTGLICEWNSGISGTIYSFSLIVILDAVHAIAVLVLSLSIFARIQQQSHNRRALAVGSGNDGNLQSRSGSSATLTMIALAIVTVVTYGLDSVSVIANTLSYYLPGASLHFQLISLQIFLFFVLCTVIPHCVNFFIYLVFIPSFRRASFCLKENGALKALSSNNIESNKLK